MKRRFILLTLILPLLNACSDTETTTTTSPSATKPEVVATSTMVADMVTRIAGDDLEINAMMKPGVDPHTYQPPTRVYSDLRNASAIIYNGMHLEGKLTDAFETQGAKALAITDHLPKDQLILAEAIDESYGDPHIWGDAQLWAQAVPAVVAKLSELAPAKAADFAERGKVYQQEIEALHQWALLRIAEIPEKNRILITSHDAFGYFGRAYGIRVVGIQGISTVDQASGNDVLKAISFIKENGIKAIFRESSVSPKVIDEIADKAGVNIGETLFSDSSGELGKMEADPSGGPDYDLGTYIGMMKHNINAIVTALKE